MKKLIDNTVVLGVLFALIALITLITYVLTSLDAGQGNLLMPLDDVYIHFQYARQLATGHPYQYNLIDPPTSGATSLLYPYILAFGYLIGFKGLWLGLWAMIVGTIALFASMIAVYRLCKVLDVPQWLSVLTAVSFGLTGSIAWHFMSGMETGIIITLLLWVLLFVIEKRLFPFLIIAIFLTITRPEGGLVSAIACGALFLRLWQDYSKENKRAYLLLLAIPILAIGLQPLVNLLITGTTVATGAQAKSILSSVPQDYGVIIGQIWDNFSRMWLEFITGYDIREGRGWYLPIFTGLIGLGAIPLLLFKKNYRLIGLMLLGWFLILTLALSTLDNAFWHFKRYQMPMLALFFPLSAWVVADGLRRFPKIRYPVYAFDALVLPVFVIALFVQFQHYHAMNVSYVYHQPYQMGIWLRDNTPEDALVAVHDVGLMRYVSGRSTLDIVGLTTPNAASYWRNGPGSVAEFLLNERPDYIASYGRGHGYGLAYLADTSLYANQLADFTIDDWQAHLNVALAAPSQGIYQPDWDEIQINYAPAPLCGNSLYGQANVDDRLAYINVADIDSEATSSYQWNTDNLIGFATEVRDFGISTLAYRLINEFEEFTIQLDETIDYPVMLVTQVHTASAGTINIYANDALIDTQWIPEGPGGRLNISTAIPEYLYEDTINIRIVPYIEDGYYMPICHTVRQFFSVPSYDSEPLANYQNDAVSLMDFGTRTLPEAPQLLTIDFIWYIGETHPEGDYKFFAHLYDNRDEIPVLQWDGYFTGMPLGNWQRGILVEPYSHMVFDTTHLPAGTYQLAIGFYNPNDPTDRLIPESDVYEVSPDGRLWLGEVEIE